MPRIPLSSIAVLVLALAHGAAPAHAAQPPEIAQAVADKGALQARYQKSKAALESLTAEYQAASARFDATEAAIDREEKVIKHRQGMLDLRKREYREALARCDNPGCVEGLNPQRDAINAEQVLLNRDIDTFNVGMDQRESEAAKLDMLEAHLAELREQVKGLEAEIAGR